MGDVPFGFIILLICFFVGALVLTIGLHLVKQKRLQRLKDPHRDHLRSRG